MWTTISPRNIQGVPWDWAKRRRFVLRRARNTCELAYHGCTIQATEVDHIVPLAGHGYDNLQAVCQHCHRIKTEPERMEGFQQYQDRGKRPTKPHPGMIEE